MTIKEKIYRDSFSLFLDSKIPDDIFNNYINDKDGEATSILQWWIIDNMKEELDYWCTGIGIIEAVEHLYNCALENGNLTKLKE